MLDYMYDYYAFIINMYNKIIIISFLLNRFFFTFI